jgi:hypothetical protein
LKKAEGQFFSGRSNHWEHFNCFGQKRDQQTLRQSLIVRQAVSIVAHGAIWGQGHGMKKVAARRTSILSRHRGMTIGDPFIGIVPFRLDLMARKK